MLMTNTHRPTSPTKAAGLLSAMVVAIASHAQAVPDADEQVAARRDGFRQRLLERFDSDEDGVLSDEERAAMPRRGKGRLRHRGRFGRRGPPLQRFDTDNDGVLNDEERANARAARKRRAIEQDDGTGAGTLDDEERSARSHRGKKRFRRRGRFGRPVAQLRRFDVDKDGTLSEEERTTARAARQKHIARRKKHIIERFDADGDGVLNEEEKQTLRERPRGRRRCRGHHGKQRRTSRNEE